MNKKDYKDFCELGDKYEKVQKDFLQLECTIKNEYISKAKIRGIIEASKWVVQLYSRNETTKLIYKNEIERINFKIKIYEDLLKWED